MSTSSINFAAAYSSSELKTTVDALSAWLERHSGIPYFTFEQIYRDLGNKVTADYLSRVLVRLVAAGELSVKYRVRFCNGEYSEDAFDSPKEVPQAVYDQSFELVKLSSNDKIIPAYSYAHH